MPGANSRRAMTETQAITCVEGWAPQKTTALDLVAMAMTLGCLACCAWIIHALPTVQPVIEQVVQQAIGCASECPR